jgi:hypothetical protein
METAGWMIVLPVARLLSTKKPIKVKFDGQ